MSFVESKSNQENYVNPCPCGLYYEDVKNFCLQNYFVCPAPYANDSRNADGTRMICNQPLGRHPHDPIQTIQNYQYAPYNLPVTFNNTNRFAMPAPGSSSSVGHYLHQNVSSFPQLYQQESGVSVIHEISLNPPSIKNTNLIPDLPSYNRYQFTISPAFGDDYIVGNLVEIQKDIEDQIMEHKRDGRICKENIPFHCVINPPRHGKSLLLDRLFVNDESVIVIGVTYNSTTGLIPEETHDVHSAFKWFWIRVLKSMLQIFAELESLSNLLESREYFWAEIKSIIISGLCSNPFIDENGNEKNILFCIDEFSLLSDKLKQEWDEDQQYQFISKLHQTKKPSYPFRQFVMTGFHSYMHELLASSSIIKAYTLELCDFTSSRPLLRKIFETYQKKNFLFPLFLFEIIKSTPGLIGYWAELVKTSKNWVNYDKFTRQLRWMKNITKTDNLKTNWGLIFQHLLNISSDSSQYVEIGENIVNAEIGIEDPEEITPLCFVFITKKAYEKRIGENNIQKQILFELNQLFTFFENMNKNKRGTPFEKLTITALYIRLLLIVHIRFVSDNTEEIVEIPFSSFIPISEDDCYSGIHPYSNLPFSVHLIRDKDSLKQLLLAPLYNIFPLGIDSLNVSWDENRESTLKSLITSNAKDYQLSQYYNDHTMILSSKTPPQPNLEIICRLADKIDEESLLELFNTLKTGKRPEEIQECLSEIQITWFRQLQTLLNALKSMIDSNYSLIPTKNSAEAADLIIIWKEQKLEGECIHISAMEIKDQRITKLSKWQKKWESLMSLFCILHWMPFFFPEINLTLHFIFAGREHS